MSFTILEPRSTQHVSLVYIIIHLQPSDPNNIKTTLGQCIILAGCNSDTIFTYKNAFGMRFTPLEPRSTRHVLLVYIYFTSAVTR